MITVVSVGEHLHILQNLDQRLYLLSFLEIVQPDYQLLQSFLVLLLAPLTAATGHDGPSAEQAAPPAPRTAAPPGPLLPGHRSGASTAPSPPPQRPARPRRTHGRLFMRRAATPHPARPALPEPPPPAASSSPTQAPKRSSVACERLAEAGRPADPWRAAQTRLERGPGLDDPDRDPLAGPGGPNPRGGGAARPGSRKKLTQRTRPAESPGLEPGQRPEEARGRPPAAPRRPGLPPPQPPKVWELGRGKMKAASYLQI